jgi:dihydroflavonol-4-reductase
VVVNPGHVFGRGDVYRSSTDVVRRFLQRRIPAYVDGALNIVDAEDVARGHLLADELGRPGERYILGNRNFTLDRLFADLGRLSGVEPPAVKLPLPAALAMAAAYPAGPRFRVSGYTVGVGALEGSAAATDERAGAGRVVLFSFDPAFRGYAEGTERLLANALLAPSG